MYEDDVANRVRPNKAKTKTFYLSATLYFWWELTPLGRKCEQRTRASIQKYLSLLRPVKPPTDDGFSSMCVYMREGECVCVCFVCVRA